MRRDGDQGNAEGETKKTIQRSFHGPLQEPASLGQSMTNGGCNVMDEVAYRVPAKCLDPVNHDGPADPEHRRRSDR